MLTSPLWYDVVRARRSAKFASATTYADVYVTNKIAYDAANWIKEPKSIEHNFQTEKLMKEYLK